MPAGLHGVAQCDCGGCRRGRKVQTWQKGANLAERCKPGRKVQTWQKGANLAERCKPGRKVQTWQKGAILAKGAKSGYPPCTFAPSAPSLRYRSSFTCCR